MRDSLAIGRLLRGRKAVGRVGRTIVDACPGTQIDDACSLIKTTRDEVVASVTTRGAVCGSACTFLLFGAVTREVAPDAAVAVHGPKVGMEFRLNVNEKRREEAIAKAYSEAERLAFAYVEEMGISRELMTLAASISHESLQVLTRQELSASGSTPGILWRRPGLWKKRNAPLFARWRRSGTATAFEGWSGSLFATARCTRDCCSSTNLARTPPPSGSWR